MNFYFGHMLLEQFCAFQVLGELFLANFFNDMFIEIIIYSGG